MRPIAVNNARYVVKRTQQPSGKVRTDPYLQVDLDGHPVFIEREQRAAHREIIIFDWTPHARRYETAGEFGDLEYGHFLRFESASRDARIVDLFLQFIDDVDGGTFQAGKRIYPRKPPRRAHEWRPSSSGHHPTGP